MQTATLSGISRGRFDVLKVRNASTGIYEDVLGGGGGSGGATNTDMGAYSTTMEVLALISSSLTPYATYTQTSLSITSSVSTALLAYATTIEADAAVAQALQAYVTIVSLNAQLNNYALTSAVNAAIVGKLDTLTGSGSVVITGTGASRNIHVPDLGVYVTSTSLNSLLDSYALTSDLSAYATAASQQEYVISTLNYIQANYLAPTYSFTVGPGIHADLTPNTIIYH
jgi:hypothetical protein